MNKRDKDRFSRELLTPEIDLGSGKARLGYVICGGVALVVGIAFLWYGYQREPEYLRYVAALKPGTSYIPGGPYVFMGLGALLSAGGIGGLLLAVMPSGFLRSRQRGFALTVVGLLALWALFFFWQGDLRIISALPSALVVFGTGLKILRVPDSQCSASAILQGRSGAVRFADGRF
jgi:hypothetical protein